MRASQKGQPAVVFDDAIVVLGKPKLAERIVERAARGDEKHRHMQTAAGLRCFALGHLILNPPQQDSARAALLGALSPWSVKPALTVAADSDIAVDADIHQHPEPYQHRDHRRTAV